MTASYPTLVDYIGDLRAPDRLTAPPGGSVGPLDPYLCDIAEEVRAAFGAAARKAIIRHHAATLSRLWLPETYGDIEKVTQRLAEWCDQLNLISDSGIVGRQQIGGAACHR